MVPLTLFQANYNKKQNSQLQPARSAGCNWLFQYFQQMIFDQNMGTTNSVPLTDNIDSY